MKPDSVSFVPKAKSIIRGALSSLTFRVLLVVALYASTILGMFLLANNMVNNLLTSSFPTVEMFDEYSEALTEDSFDVLSHTVSEPSQLLVFDGEGKRLYSSSTQIADVITAQDLPIIKGSEENHTFYEVLERRTDKGTLTYEIDLCSLSEEDNTKIVLASCICNADGWIQEGDLFGERTQLTQRELSLLRGTYGAGMSIEKLEYQAADGEDRTLVLVSPTITDTSYEKLVGQIESVWYATIPLTLIATILIVIVIARMVRHALRPLDLAIKVRRSTPNKAANNAELPLELRPTYKSFLNLMDELDESRSEKQRAIADISHDLKTPLTIIRGYARAFSEGCVPPEKEDAYLHAIDEKAGIACELIDSLFAYAKTDHPSFEAKLERLDVCEEVRLAVIERQTDIEQNNCSLEVDIATESLHAQVDQSLLRRALNNLIDNTYKHNPSDTQVFISCNQVKSKIVIAVANTGCAIPEELREDLFKPFVTSNEARSPGKGTGLGLAIANRCIQLQHGKLSFTKNPTPPYCTEALIELPHDGS